MRPLYEWIISSNLSLNLPYLLRKILPFSKPIPTCFRPPISCHLEGGMASWCFDSLCSALRVRVDL